MFIDILDIVDTFYVGHLSCAFTNSLNCENKYSTNVWSKFIMTYNIQYTDKNVAR